MRKKDEDIIEIDFVRLLKALWQRAWILVFAMMVFGAAGFSYANFMVTPLYQSSALMYVNNSTLSVGNTSVSLADLTASQSLVNTYLVILKTRLTLNDVIEEADLTYSYEQLCNMITAEAVEETEIFRINVTSPDAKEAELIANTIAEILPEKISEIMDGSSVRTVDYAIVPMQKASPNITSYTLKGILLGLVLSGSVIVLLELFDDQIHDEEYLINTYQLPVLAVLPDLVSTRPGKGYYKYREAAEDRKP